MLRTYGTLPLTYLFFYRYLAPTAPSGGSFGVDILYFDNTTTDNNDTKEDSVRGQILAERFTSNKTVPNSYWGRNMCHALDQMRPGYIAYLRHATPYLFIFLPIFGTYGAA